MKLSFLTTLGIIFLILIIILFFLGIIIMTSILFDTHNKISKLLEIIEKEIKKGSV